MLLIIQIFESLQLYLVSLILNFEIRYKLSIITYSFFTLNVLYDAFLSNYIHLLNFRSIITVTTPHCFRSCKRMFENTHYFKTMNFNHSESIPFCNKL